MAQFIKKYKHGLIILVYAIVYLMFFGYLEHRPVRGFHAIDTVFDDYIPFCEYFIVPYLLWFPYQVVTVLYFIFKNKNKKEYYQLVFNMMMGMTIFLIISTLWPNGHHLRPAVMPRDNIFTRLVAFLYHTDTPTNLWPSIHVYNSLGTHFAVIRNEKLRKNPAVHTASLILCVSIILSTMFIKQHSVFDVLTAFIMAAVMYIVVYGMDIVTIWQNHRYEVRTRKQIRQV